MMEAVVMVMEMVVMMMEPGSCEADCSSHNTFVYQENPAVCSL